jgi:hypothetical protein
VSGLAGADHAFGFELVGGQQVRCQTKSADGFFYLITGEPLESIGELIVSCEPREITAITIQSLFPAHQ